MQSTVTLEWLFVWIRAALIQLLINKENRLNQIKFDVFWCVNVYSILPNRVWQFFFNIRTCTHFNKLRCTHVYNQCSWNGFLFLIFSYIPCEMSLLQYLPRTCLWHQSNIIEKIFLKGTMIFYFMHYLRVVIIFFSMGLCKSALSGYSLGKIRFLSFFVLLFLCFCIFGF